jgi:hypothetical protein
MIIKKMFKASLFSALALGFVACGLEAGNESSSVVDTDIGNDNRVDNSVRWERGESGGGVGFDDEKGANPNCSSGVQSGADGALGFLWKPESENDGALVVLFPSAYDVEFERVEAELANGAGVEAGEFAGFTNGDRQTWRFDESGGAYSGLVLVYDKAQECMWQVSTPSERVD